MFRAPGTAIALGVYDVDTPLSTVRAYIAVPKRDRLAGIICCRIHIRRVPCKPLCRKCLETAYEIKLELVGEPDWWGDRGRYDGGGR